MGDVITGIDFASDSARERFLRHREAAGLRVLPVVDKENPSEDAMVRLSIRRELRRNVVEWAEEAGLSHLVDAVIGTEPSEYVAPGDDCA